MSIFTAYIQMHSVFNAPLNVRMDQKVNDLYTHTHAKVAKPKWFNPFFSVNLYTENTSALVWIWNPHWTNDTNFNVCKLWKWAENQVTFCRRFKTVRENVHLFLILCIYGFYGVFMPLFLFEESLCRCCWRHFNFIIQSIFSLFDILFLSTGIQSLAL